jgi:hypothetical protein
MKSKSLFAAATVLLTPVLAFAGTKDSANLELTQQVTVAGTQLSPGHYKLTWEGDGPDTTVSFAEGKKTIATAPAKLVSNRANEEAIETTTADGNTSVLRAIDLKDVTLQFENDAPAAGN